MSNVIFTEKQLEAFNSIKNGENVFLTGPAGSGKSFLLNHFITEYKGEKSEIFITSTTGLSSILIDGITIHRYAGIGTGDKDIDTYYKKIIKMKNLRDRWRNTKILIIDEISMMDGELFDKLEILAKKIRKNDAPFGGIQLILSGDFLQLPPVKSNDFAFDAISWDFVVDKVFYFNEIIRQDDNSLKYVLNNIRVGVVDENVKRLLDSCLNKKLTNEEGIIPTLLFSKKQMVIEYNQKKLKKLIDTGKDNYIYKSTYQFSDNISESTKEFYKELLNTQYHVEDEILISLHSQVMLTINMPEFQLANGSRGIVVDFIKEDDNVAFPVVLFLHGKSKVIKNFEYSIDENGVLVKKIQIPLILSWAITIHKAQGCTLELLQTDIGESIFEYGQVYVVLSRIKSIDGLSLINIDYSKIKAHPHALEFYTAKL